MASQTPPSNTAPGSAAKDVLAFLDDLDNFSASAPGTPNAGATTAPAPTGSASAPSATASAEAGKPGGGKSAAAGGEDAQSVLDFLDEITQRSSTPTAAIPDLPAKKPTTTSQPAIPRPSSRGSLNRSVGPGGGVSAGGRKSTDSVRSMRASTPSSSSPAAPALASTHVSTPSSGGGGWGWGSLLSSATTALQTARTAAEENISKGLSSIPTTASSFLSETPQGPSSNVPADVNSPLGPGAEGSGLVGVGAADLEGIQNRLQGQAKKWSEGVMGFVRTAAKAAGVEDVDKFGNDLRATSMKTLQDILNAVAPPIAEHELIEVNLSHDMVGYEGVETLVYRALAKIMEQVEGGTLIVNKGTEDSSNPTASASLSNLLAGNEDDVERNLNLVEGLEEGYKLAEANLEGLIKRTFKNAPTDQSSGEKSGSHGRTSSVGAGAGAGGSTIPVTVCKVYMRIQPVISALPFQSIATAIATSSSEPPKTPATSSTEDKQLFFILLLRDPTNGLVHRTLTQGMPASWLEIPFEENEWVEDCMVDVIKKGVEIVGQDYISGRMSGRSLKSEALASSIPSVLVQPPSAPAPIDDKDKETKVEEGATAVGDGKKEATEA